MQIFRDHKLNIALLVSASWHLFCIFLVSPTFLPKYIDRNTTSLSFLGSILERVSGSYGEGFSGLERASLVKKLDKPKSFLKPKGPQLEKGQDFLLLEKDTEPKLFNNYPKSDIYQLRFHGNLIEGKARERLVLYKPELPSVFVLNPNFGSNYTMKIRFRITRHGFLQSPECVESSGNPYIDSMAIRYLRRWQFVPAGDREKDTVEGIICLSF